MAFNEIGMRGSRRDSGVKLHYLCGIPDFILVAKNVWLVMNTNVKSVLLYGSETWKTTKSLQSKLQVFVNKCLRYILKIWWPNKITNKELWRKTNQEDNTSTIRRRKWNWIGHTLRKDSATNITRQALDYNPQGKRKRGRPKSNWRRSTLKDLETVGMTWQEAKVMA